MTAALLLTLLISMTACLALLLPPLVKLCKPCNGEEITREWLEDFSISTYQPMEGLLDNEDFAFLSRQPGFDLRLYRKLRRERLRIFRQYMDRLIADFNRLHAVARLLLARDTSTDHSDVFLRLILLKLRFALTVFRTELNYRLCCIGYRSLGVKGLLLQLEEMNLQLAYILNLGAA